MPSLPRLLFLSHCLPYPPQSGVTIRTFNILKQLRKEFDVTLLMFSRANHQADQAARDAARATLEGHGLHTSPAVPVAAERSKPRRAWDHLRSLATGHAYTFYEYGSDEFGRELRDAITGAPPAIVHLDSLDLHAWVSALPPVPTVCTHHDIESDALRRRAEHVSPPPLRWYVRHQAALVERTERTLAPRFTANVVMSPVDATRLAKIAPGSRTIVVPNGVDTEYFTPGRADAVVPGRIVFIGGTYFFPNRDAVEYLLREIWPLVRAVRPAATLHLIGRASEADRERYGAHAGVSCLGGVDDIRPHVAEACCSVVPIRIGGGTRIKILDSWSMGKAVVSTSLGCEGLRADDGHNILVRDEPATFADAIVHLIDDAALRDSLGASGRRTVEAVYAWDIAGRDMRAAYAALLAA
ncbi:MAG: glycosyltransferase family 4 protein [Gemmatimonadaceae bacterium]